METIGIHRNIALGLSKEVEPPPCVKAHEPVLTSTRNVPELSAATGSNFAFVLPVRPEWEGALAASHRPDADGSVTLDGEATIPLAILHHPRTRQLRNSALGLAVRSAAESPMRQLESVKPCGWQPDGPRCKTRYGQTDLVTGATGSPLRRSGSRGMRQRLHPKSVDSLAGIGIRWADWIGLPSHSSCILLAFITWRKR